MTYPVIRIDGWRKLSDETMGSKRKYWFEADAGVKYLFKYPRLNSGEAWAEKAVAEIARLLSIPHATYELAVFEGDNGTISEDILRKEEGNDLRHGNELLQLFNPEYDMEKQQRQSEHSYARITRILSGVNARWPKGYPIVGQALDGLEVFAGYLVLDALVSHSDRHHQNWAVIGKYDQNRDEHTVEIAPTYDHASSLGRELTDEKRELYLSMENGIKTYADRCRSGIYWLESDHKACHPIRLVSLAAGEDPISHIHWLRTVAALHVEDIRHIFASFPDGWISDSAARFAIELIEQNKTQLSDLLAEMES
jgi:hypothetical protein